MAYRPQEQQQFVMDDFRVGMVHENALPAPGALSLWSRGVVVTPDGKISTGVGFCPGVLVPQEHDSDFFEHLNQIYWWERPSGGGTFLAATSKGMGIGRIFRFTSAPPDHRAVRDDWFGTPAEGKGYFYPIPLDVVYTDDRRMDVECRDDFAYIDFVPFGDYCFVLDGRNSPLLIHPNLAISHARFPDVGEGFFPEVIDGGVAEAVSAGAYVYAFVPVVGKLGEAPVGDPRSGGLGFISVSVTGTLRDEDGNLLIDVMNYSVDGNYTLAGHLTFGRTGTPEQSWGGYVLFRGLSQAWRAFPGMYKIRVYRTLKGSAGEFFYIGSVGQGEDTFMDVLPDYAVGQALDAGMGKVPVGRLGLSHKNRLWIVGDLDSGFHNILRYSSYGQPLRFPEEYFLYEPQLFRDDTVVRVVAVRGNFYLLLRKSIVMLIGETPADYALVPVHYGVGCVAPQSVAEWRNGVVFLSERGPYFFDGGSPKYLGGRMEDFFADAQRGHKGWETAVGAVSGNTYYLSFHEDYYCESTPGPGSTNNKTLALSLETGAWTDATTMPFDSAVPGPRGDPFVARSKTVDNAGGVYRLMEGWPWTYRGGTASSDGLSYGDSPTNTRHQPYVKFEGLDFGKPQVRKQLRRIEVSYTGYYDDMWRSLVSTDEVTTAEYSPWSAGAEMDDWLLWNFSNGEDRVTPTRMRRSQSVYFPADQSGGARGSNMVGKSFDIALQVKHAHVPQWAIIHSLAFYYVEEDDR